MRTQQALLIIVAGLFTAAALAQKSDSSSVRGAAYEARQAGEWEKAADAFVELHDLEPSEPRWVMEAADAMGKAGRIRDAVSLLWQSKDKYPDALELRVQLAKSLHLQADQERASGSSTDATKSYYMDAADLAGKVVTARADHIEARLLLAQAHFQLGRFDQAIAEAEKVAEFDASNSGGHVIIGQIWYWRFRNQLDSIYRNGLRGSERQEAMQVVDNARKQARAAFKRSLDADPDRAIAAVRLGDIAGWSGEPERAAEHYEAALSTDPRQVGQIDTDWLTKSVGAERVAAMWDAARDAYAKRKDAKPELRAILEYRAGLVKFYGEDLEGARACFEQVLACADEHPEYRDALYWLMRITYWEGNRDAARAQALAFARDDPKAFADAIRTSQDRAEATSILQYLADSAFRAGKPRASRDLNYVLASLVQTAPAWNNYALLCRDTGRYEDAWKGYQYALQEERSPQLLNDGAVILQYHLSTPANLAKARKMYIEAIELAKAQLAEGVSDDEARGRTRQALRDATSNLAKLR